MSKDCWRMGELEGGAGFFGREERWEEGENEVPELARGRGGRGSEIEGEDARGVAG